MAKKRCYYLIEVRDGEEPWETPARGPFTPWLHIFDSARERNAFLENGRPVQKDHYLSVIDSRRARDCEYYHFCRFGYGSYCKYEEINSGIKPARPVILHYTVE